MQQDLHDLLDYAQRTWPASPIVLVATGLAARVALKAVAQDRRVTLLVLLSSILDVKATLLSVHQKDVIDIHARGDRLGVINLLGCTINADHWLEDAMKGGYADIKTTVKDGGNIGTPVILLTSEHSAAAHHQPGPHVQPAVGARFGGSYALPEPS